MARRTAAALALALLLAACCSPAARAAAPRRALQQSGGPCGGAPPASPDARGVRLALAPDPSMAYGARHITIANIDLNNRAYKGDAAAAAKTIRSKCGAPPLDLTAAMTKLEGWTVDDWKSKSSSKTYVMTITDPQVDKWGACLGSKVPGVYGVVGPSCGKKTPWHNTFYGLFYPTDQKAATKLQAQITGGRLGSFAPYLVLSPANEGVPKGSNGAGFKWTKI